MYRTFKKIQGGSVLLRRWSKRIKLLFISTNIWVDEIIAEILLYTEESIEGAKSWVNWVVISWATRGVGEKLDTANVLLSWLSFLLLIFSIIFWVEIFIALRFVIADFFCNYYEKKKLQFFFFNAFIINIILYVLLKNYSEVIFNMAF